MTNNVPLKELQPFVRILILDDDVDVGQSTQFMLQQEGYPYVHFTDAVDEAVGMLPQVNILLIDKFLGKGIDGLDIVREAKIRYQTKLDVILYSGSVDKDMARIAHEAGATAFLEKPLKFDHLALWVKETSQRIWLKNILDAIPDEIMVVDSGDFGRIHYVNDAKRKIFENGKCLINDYCYKRFEIRGDGCTPCEGCVTARAKNDEHAVRTYWTYQSRLGGRGYADLHAVALKDQVGDVRAIIETARDRTAREIMEKSFRKIENEPDYHKRMQLFLDGFIDMGYKRVRFYRRVTSNGRACYQGIDARNMPEDFDIHSLVYFVSKNKPCAMVETRKKPILYRVVPNSGEKWIQSRTYQFLYKVDPDYVDQNDILSKERWIDVPVMANNEIIAKVSVEPDDDYFVSSYDMEVLADYATLAGQAIANSQQLAQLQVNNETNEAIIKLSSKITRLRDNSCWMDYAAKKVSEVLSAGGCSIFIYDEQSQSLMKTASYLCDKNRKKVKDNLKEEYPAGSYMINRVFDHGKTIFKNNLVDIVKKELASGYEDNINFLSYQKLSTLINEPLYNAMYVIIRRDTQKIGVIRLLNKRKTDFFGNTDFTSGDKRALRALAAQIAVAFSNKSMLDEIKDWQNYRKFVTQEYSHTLKNLLQPVVSFAEFLEKDPDDKKLWDLLRNEIIRMKTTIQTMVKLVCKDEESLQLKKEWVNINEMLKEVVQPYVIYYEGKNMTIDLCLDQELGNEFIDKTLLYDAVANLMDNAYKYGHDDTPVLVESENKNSNFTISITDIGAQISKQERKKIFEEFYIGRKVYDKVSQIGLGLTYVKTVVEAHDGKVFVDSKFTKGAKIVIQIPK